MKIFRAYHLPGAMPGTGDVMMREPSLPIAIIYQKGRQASETVFLRPQSELKGDNIRSVTGLSEGVDC